MVTHRDINTSGLRTMILLLLVSGAAVLLISPSLAGTGVTITSDGSRSYYLGENMVFQGQDTGSDSVYLFLTGPNLPPKGGKLTEPSIPAISGNPDTFTLVKTRPDKSWEYSYYTANIPLDAGTYTVYAARQSKNLDESGSDAARIGIIVKKPFLTARISSPDVVMGQPFSVSGSAEGIPPEVQIWIFGDDHIFTTKIPVQSDASFIYNADPAMSRSLKAGQYYLIVQHPMQNNRFDIDVSGDYIRNLNLDNGTNLFRISGQGSLQGSTAVDALVAAFHDSLDSDSTYSVDTYTVIPFFVSDAGSPALQETVVRIPSQHLPIQYTASIGAGRSIDRRNRLVESGVIGIFPDFADFVKLHMSKETGETI